MLKGLHLHYWGVVIYQYCFPSTGYLYFLHFFWLVAASSLDEHLDRDIRHDDVYEELTPTTYCKTNKKRTLTVPRSLFLHTKQGPAMPVRKFRT